LYCIADASGWAYYARGSGVGQGSKYLIIDKAMTFYAGQERCQRLGGYLAHVNSLREQLFIEDFLVQALEKLGT